MVNTDYQPPVATLLTYGDVRDFSRTEWRDYVQELDLDETHIPELIRMVTDEELNSASSESSEVWAPTHAWRALAQLGAETAVEPLLELLENPDDDWIHEDFPKVMSLIGPSTIPRLQEYLADDSHDIYSRAAIAGCFPAMQKRHPQERDRCISALIQQLEKFHKNTPSLNGFIIAELCHLEAVEQAPEIKRAFAARCVDLSIVGDWDDVQIALGLKTHREIPRRASIQTKSVGPIPSSIGSMMTSSDDRSAPKGFAGQAKSKTSKKSKKKKG